MIAAADANDRKLAICLQVRFRESIRAMKAALNSGRFGKLLEGDAYMKWFRPTDYYLMDDWRSKRDQGAGVTIQHAFHYIDLLHHLMGPVAVVDARMTNLAHPQVQLEDTLKAFLHFESGAEGLVEASTALWPGRPPRIEVNGADGTAITEGEVVLAWDFREERPEDEQIRQIGRGAVAAGGTGAADLSYEEHMWLIEDMVDAIHEDRDPYVNARNARHSLEIALAMYLSADAGKPIELPLPADTESDGPTADASRRQMRRSEQHGNGPPGRCRCRYLRLPAQPGLQLEHVRMNSAAFEGLHVVLGEERAGGRVGDRHQLHQADVVRARDAGRNVVVHREVQVILQHIGMPLLEPWRCAMRTNSRRSAPE